MSRLPHKEPEPGLSPQFQADVLDQSTYLSVPSPRILMSQPEDRVPTESHCPQLPSGFSVP